ncbi:hypothetical protein [Paenibacillus xylanexedens]|nr:hypothetical protein [Paenibacillus xylanexedens]
MAKGLIDWYEEGLWYVHAKWVILYISLMPYGITIVYDYISK